MAAIANFISFSDTRQECLSWPEAGPGNSNRYPVFGKVASLGGSTPNTQSVKEFNYRLRE